MSIFENFTAFLAEIVKIAWSITTALNDTATAIETVSQTDLQNSVVIQYMGYVVNVMGRPLWILFALLLQIGIGLFIYTTFLKGINQVKETLIIIKK